MTSSVDNMPSAPDDYQLLLPEGWFRLSLEPEKRERSVGALLDRQLKGIDNAAHFRRDLRQELMRRAADAYRGGGIELYLSMQQAGSLTIPASLLVTLLPSPPSGGQLPQAAELAADLSAKAKGKRHISVVDLAAGKAVRIREEIESLPGEDDYALPSVTLEHRLCIPGTDAQLLLTFSTPLIQIADAMCELFDAIAGSLTWKAG
ncbi:hypothetical protein [Streptomyces sp. A5-4]|uniref:hypothetical protein n=1 Tax=Streptomyces sp. A5-4 TaxID=3384771 RepID=UPI003DA9EFF5